MFADPSYKSTAPNLYKFFLTLDKYLNEDKYVRLGLLACDFKNSPTLLNFRRLVYEVGFIESALMMNTEYPTHAFG